MSEYSTYDLEQMAAGEIETPDDATERVDALRHANEAILAQYPDAEMVPKIRAATGERQVRHVPVFLAVAVALLVGLLYALQPPPSAVVQPTIRLKGPALNLHMFIHEPTGHRILERGEAVSAGDTVQAKIGLAAPAHVALFSIDGAGVVTAIDPPLLDGEAVFYNRGARSAPTSTELDDAPDFERFVVVACAESFNVHEIVGKVKDGADVEPCSIETHQLSKR